MGKEKEIVDEIEDVLGLNGSEENPNTTTTDTKDENNSEPKKDENFTGESEPEKQTEKKTTTKTQNSTVTLTQEQIKINSEMTKLDSKLEELEKNSTVDTNEFYENLDKHLSDEEQQLEFDDKSAYLKLVNAKEKEYIKSNSKDEEIENIKSQKEELQKVYDRQDAIVGVTAKFPEFNYEKTMEFYQSDLTPRQQQEILDTAKSYEDVYELTYKKYLESNPQNIQTQQAPNIPNVNNVRKETVASKSIENGFKTDDEELQEALGLA